jgi:hypothetical protein
MVNKRAIRERQLHKNFTAFEDFETSFTSKDDIDCYRKEKMAEVKKNVSFIKKRFNKRINVLEVGSGNSKLLYSLEEEGILKEGYGVDISKSRINFANLWKRDIQSKVNNVCANILDYDLTILPNFDLIYCSDMAFQLFEPVKKGTEHFLIKKFFSKLAIDGKIILELDDSKSLLELMQDNKVKTWQEFDESDPWKYLLWDSSYSRETKYLKTKKVFIKRDMSEISKSEIVLKLYNREAAKSLLRKHFFKNVEIFENWSISGDTNTDEFIVLGVKQGDLYAE